MSKITNIFITSGRKRKLFLIKMSADKPTVIIDNGSYNIKVGFSCDNHPVSIFRNVVGRPNYLKGYYGREDYDVYLGEDAIDQAKDVDLCSPMVDGQIVNWDNMERVWHHIFYRELKAAPDDRDILLACSPKMNFKEKIRCCEVFMETLNCPSLCIQPQCVLALYAFGATSGICVDIEHDNTNINPVYEGSIITYAQMQTSLGGNQISEYIKRELPMRSFDINVQHHDILDDIKRKCLYITSDSAMSRNDCCKNYLLPDGIEINISQESFMAAEMIFQPDLVVGKECKYLPLHKAIVASASKCDSDITPELFDAVILCGGTSLIPGFASRLTLEINNSSGVPISLLYSCEAHAVSFLGGAIFATLPDSTQLWVSKYQYEEYGEKIIGKKFL